MTGRGRRRRAVSALALALVTATLVVVVGRGAVTPAGAAAVTVVRTSADTYWTPDAPLFVLLLGDDARPGAGCGCADAIHVVGIPPGGGQATMINIPRDTRVTIPGQGVGKINASLTGGPELAALTVGAFLGVPIAYTLVVGFDALPALVDEMGGVVVDVPTRILDHASGADLEPGPVVMDGQAAIAFSRARKSVDGGDFGRTANQATLIISALAQLRATGTGAGDEIAYLGTLMRHVRADGLSAQELYRLGRLGLSIDPANVRSVTMPGSVVTIGGTSYVVATRQASEVFADFADDAILELW